MTKGPTNYQVQQLLDALQARAVKSNLWKRVAKDLKKPARQRRTVNIYKIEKNAGDGETILVPGKVLSMGSLKKKVDVAALNFSSEAKRKITEAKGKALTIGELLDKNPQGNKVRILG